jgi:hypothetical protein
MNDIFRQQLDRHPNNSQVKSDVMVDFASYYEYGLDEGYIGDELISRESGECPCKDCSSNEKLEKLYCRKFDEATGDKLEKWDDLQYILCPPRLLGYILREKQWAQLDLEKIKPTKDDVAVFEKMLHLKSTPDSSLDEAEIKKLLMSLVETHGQDQVQDLVEDKGKGLVVLLYGTWEINLI